MEIEGSTLTLNWTGALELKSGWGPNDSALSITPFLQFRGDVLAKDGRPRCHVVVIAACEGEAILISNWVRAKRSELEDLIGSGLQSLSWLATDIAPVGHFAQGTLRAVAVDCSQFVVVSFEARFTGCNLTALILALLRRAKARLFALTIDRQEDNIWEFEPVVTDHSSDGYEEIDLSAIQLPTLPGGLFRSGLLEYLVATQCGGRCADSPDAAVGE